jgi:predicted pyridoxine 5'-phosphate oxidase superfamily flavin-nucleotide-binding protein
MSDSPDTPWHAGEREAQLRAGVEKTPLGAGVRDFMPDQHRLFFAQLPFMVAATVDDLGAPVASLLVGGEGFVASPDPRTLAIAATPATPVRRHFTAGSPIGLIGIEFATRRRNRANGAIAFAGDDGLIVQVLQSFGNCPQYIHERDTELVPGEPAAFESFDGLDAAAAAQVAAADTFFVASASGPGIAAGGVDVSHRGGPAGFVRVEGVLTIPDYRGNRYFNTLGNLLLEPRAALLFVDFGAGRVLHLSGRAELAWDAQDLPGAERAWRFKVDGGWRGPAGVRAQAAVQPPSIVSAAPVVDAPRSETR